jgi:hypothetical protein
LTYCLADGAVLSALYDPHATLEFPETRKTEPPPTEVLPVTSQEHTIPSPQEIKPLPPKPFIPEIKPSQQSESSKTGKVISRIAVSLVIIVLLILSAVSVGWGVYNSIQVAKEREARQIAEREAAANKDALAAAEKRAKDAEEIVEANEAIRMGKEVWRIVKIENRTQGMMPYQLSVDGTTTEFYVDPGKSNLHYYSEDISVIYDYQYTSGYQEKRYRLTPKYVIGHKPTEAEKQQGKINYFTLDKNGDIEMYFEK